MENQNEISKANYNCQNLKDYQTEEEIKRMRNDLMNEPEDENNGNVDDLTIEEINELGIESEIDTTERTIDKNNLNSCNPVFEDKEISKNKNSDSERNKIFCGNVENMNFKFSFSQNSQDNSECNVPTEISNNKIQKENNNFQLRFYKNSKINVKLPFSDENTEPTEENIQYQNIYESFKIDNHLEKIGYSFFQFRLLIVVSLVFFVDGCEMSNINMLLSSIQNDLNLNTFQKSSLSSSIFIGFFIGSFLSGFTTNKYGRQKPIKYGIVLIFIFSFLTSISKNISQLIMMRILSGLAIGTVVPACKTLLTECIPSTYRSFVLSIVWLLHPVGTVYICYLALNNVNGKDYNWRRVLMINSMSSFILIILTQFLSESPRYLLKNGKSEEAIELLDLMGYNSKPHKKVSLNQIEKNMIYNESQMMHGFVDGTNEINENNKDDNENAEKFNISENVKDEENINESEKSSGIMIVNKPFSDGNTKKLRNKFFDQENPQGVEKSKNITTEKDSTNIKPQMFFDDKYTKLSNKQCNLNVMKLKKNLNSNNVKLLFSKKFLTTSLLLSFIWFATSFISFGLLYSLPKLFDKVSNNNKQASMEKMIKTMILVSPSAILRGCITELKFLGRRNTLALGFFGAFLNSIICYWITNYIHFFSGILKFSIHISSGTVSIYTSEVYPTEIRSLAIGFGTSITRIGAFLSSFSCEIFDSLTPKGSFVLFAITSFISFIFSISLKYETLGRPLDAENDNEDIDDNEKLKFVKKNEEYSTSRDQCKDNNFLLNNSNINSDKENNVELNLKNIII